MEGVILFADDHIFDSNRMEYKLFQKFNSIGDFSILPINNLVNLGKTITSISTYKALILDWNFNRNSDEPDIEVPDENPFEFLKESKIYSLVYIYSQTMIGNDEKEELEKLYPGKIFFETKDTNTDIENEYNKIVKGITKFEDENKHLAVPYVWCKAINQAAQNIFSELETADRFWIKELYYGSVRKFDKASGEVKDVEVEPTIEVINLFQNILAERLIQNMELTNSIREYAITNFQKEPDATSIIKLYSRLYYTHTLETDTVMTGDIYKLDSECFGVIISPECDMMKLIKKNELVEVLCFSKNDFTKIKQICNNDEDIKRAYNQEHPAFHLLPIFPFPLSENSTAVIDFKFSLKLVKGKYLDVNRKNRKIKINTPYIQQLRQRYLSYIGRVGVPTIPQSLRLLN